MQIVIDIPDKDIPQKQDFIDIPLHFIDGKVCSAGGKYGFMVLPPHGRLIDEREVYKKFYCRCLAGAAKEVLDETPTIIEADKAESEG